MSDEELTMTDAEKEIAWEVNALLMGFDNSDEDFCRSVLEDSTDAPAVLVMSVGVLKTMVDTLILAINESGIPLMHDKPLEFRDLIQLNAEFLTDSDL